MLHSVEVKDILHPKWFKKRKGKIRLFRAVDENYNAEIPFHHMSVNEDSIVVYQVRTDVLNPTVEDARFLRLEKDDEVFVDGYIKQLVDSKNKTKRKRDVQEKSH